MSNNGAIQVELGSFYSGEDAEHKDDNLLEMSKIFITQGEIFKSNFETLPWKQMSR